LILTNIVYLLCKLYVVFNYKVHHCFNKLIVYMIKFNFLITIILIAFLSSCDPGADDDYFNRKEPIETTITSDDLNLKISYYGPLENTIYPSVILGLSNYSARENYSLGLIKYKLTTPKNKCSLKIKLLQSTVNNETVFQEQLDLKGRKNEFFPKINWNYEKLKSLKQQGTVDLSFTCYIDNKEIDNQSLRLSYRSVNECVYGMIDEDGNYVDLKWMFAAYVNEDHPEIDNFLQEVLNTRIINSFIGYQEGSEFSVLEQVYAIWYTLQTKNVKYTSITNTSNPSDKVFTQYVRFFDEVYSKTQANCVDASVFLCSVLKRIGIKPFLVLIPGHMYMGFYTKSDKSIFRLLETTMIGSIDLNEIYEDKTYVYNLNKYVNYLTIDTYNGYFNGIYSLEYVKKEISLYSFIYAVDNNNTQWDNDLSKLNNPNNYHYQMFDIEELRKVVQPIGR